MTIRPLGYDETEAVLDVLCDSFYDYPLMRHVLGPDWPDYDTDLRRMIEVFVMARVHRGDPMIGAEIDGRVVGVATVTLPGDHKPGPAWAELRDRVWGDLGEAAYERYKDYGRAGQAYKVAEPHHDLNMLGVLHTHHGRGLAGALVRAVEQLAADDPNSVGVSLTTENPKNVGFYEHMGFEATGPFPMGPNIQTWGFFKAC